MAHDQLCYAVFETAAATQFAMITLGTGTAQKQVYVSRYVHAHHGAGWRW